MPRKGALLGLAALLAGCALGGSASAAELIEMPGSPFAVGNGPFMAAAADLDLDGLADLAVSSEVSDDVTVLLGQAGGGLAPEAGSPFGAGDRPSAVAVADFNGDDLRDLAFADFDGNTVTVLLRQPGGGYVEEAGSPIAVGMRPPWVSAADFNGDGRPDLAVLNQNSNTVTILLRQPRGGFAEEAGSPIESPGGPFQAAVADFNDDGRRDLAITGQSTADVRILLRQPGGSFAEEAGSPIAVGPNPLGIVAPDLNGDGRPDLAVANSASDTVSILLRQPGGGFAEEAGSPVPAGDTPYGVVSADFNRDRRPDLAVSNEDANTVTVLLRSPGGGFAEGLNSPVPTGRHPLRLAAADVNGDGRTDLATPNYEAATATVLLNVPDTTITSGPTGTIDDATPSFEFVTGEADATFECRIDGAAFVACTSPFKAPSLADGEHVFAVRAVDDLGNPDPTPAERSFTIALTRPPPPLQPPKPVTDPQIIPAPGILNAGEYLCLPGTWENLPPNPTFQFVWREQLTPTKQIELAKGQTFTVNPADYGLPIHCAVTATNGAGSATALSPAVIFTSAGINKLPPAYGNFRIRGIDVFQVVQANSGSQTFLFPGTGGFPVLCGAGTPTGWLFDGFSGTCKPGAEPQAAKYPGVTLDRGKPTVAVVYVDVAGGAAANPNLDLVVSLRAKRKDGTKVTTVPVKLKPNPPASATPTITANEREDPNSGVQFRLPADWVAGDFDLEATVGFQPGNISFGERQCDTIYCTLDDSYTLKDISTRATPQLLIESLQLRRAGQGALDNPAIILDAAKEVFPGGERIPSLPTATTSTSPRRKDSPSRRKSWAATPSSCAATARSRAARTSTPPRAPAVSARSTRACGHGRTTTPVGWRTSGRHRSPSATTSSWRRTTTRFQAAPSSQGGR